MNRSPAFLVVAGLLALGVAALYVGIAWLGNAHTPLYVLDFIDGQPLFNMDDSIRYFTARNAWQGAESYAWNYMLPGAVFLDGIVTSIADDNLFIARSLHTVPALFTLWFIFRAGIKLDLPRWPLLASVLIVALMPLYGFVFLSFYGENWLTFFVAAALLALVSRRYLLTALLAGLLPLIRVEGIFFILPLFLFFLFQRNWRAFLLLALPGFIHFLSLFFILDDPRDYVAWRYWFRATLAPITSAHDPVYQGHFLASINPFWTLPGLLALVLPSMRAARPLAAGATLWLVFLALNVMYAKTSFYEARYLVSIFPLVAIGWAATVSWLYRQLPWKKTITVITVLLALGIVTENMLQFDAFKTAHGDGRRWPIAGKPPLVRGFQVYPDDEMAQRRKMAQAIVRFTRENPDIDRVVVFNHQILRELDPDLLPRRVQVSWAPMDSTISLAIQDNQFYVMHPGERQYAFLELRTLDPVPGPVLLYVGQIDCIHCIPVYEARQYQVYAFSYSQSFALRNHDSRDFLLDRFGLGR